MRLRNFIKCFEFMQILYNGYKNYIAYAKTI